MHLCLWITNINGLPYLFFGPIFCPPKDSSSSLLRRFVRRRSLSNGGLVNGAAEAEFKEPDGFVNTGDEAVGLVWL